MEELKLQMGDRMPAALSIAAKAMGMTRKELIKTIEQGKLASKDFIPKFTAELRNMASGGLEAALKTPRVAQGQMVMAFQEMVESFFKGGFGDFLKTSFEILRNLFKILKPFAAIAGGFFSALSAMLEPVKIILELIVSAFEELDDQMGGGLLEGFTEGVRLLGKAIGWVLGIILSPFRLLLKMLTGIAKAFGFVTSTARAAAGATQVGAAVIDAGTKAAANSRRVQALINMGRQGANFVEKQNRLGVVRTGMLDKAWGGAQAALSVGANRQEIQTTVQTTIGFDRRAERVLKEKNTRQTTNNSRE